MVSKVLKNHKNYVHTPKHADRINKLEERFGTEPILRLFNSRKFSTIAHLGDVYSTLFYPRKGVDINFDHIVDMFRHKKTASRDIPHLMLSTRNWGSLPTMEAWKAEKIKSGAVEATAKAILEHAQRMSQTDKSVKSQARRPRGEKTGQISDQEIRSAARQVRSFIQRHPKITGENAGAVISATLSQQSLEHMRPLLDREDITPEDVADLAYISMQYGRDSALAAWDFKDRIGRTPNRLRFAARVHQKYGKSAEELFSHPLVTEKNVGIVLQGAHYFTPELVKSMLDHAREENMGSAQLSKELKGIINPAIRRHRKSWRD